MSPPTPPASPATSDPTSGVVALVMGVLGLTALPLIGSILALVFGAQARREAIAQPQRYRDDLGRIGRILGWVGISLAVAGLVIAGVGIALFIAM
jgi:hypothetical protein